MRIDQPSIPHHVAKAYGIGATAPVQQVRPVEPARQIDRPERAQRIDKTSRLVAGIVDGRVGFDRHGSPQPVRDTSSLAMYRHPADKNAAATAVHAGRSLDVTG